MSDHEFDNRAASVKPLAAFRSVSAIGKPPVTQAGFTTGNIPVSPTDCYRLVYVMRGTGRLRLKQGTTTGMELLPGCAVQTWPASTGQIKVDQNGQWVAAYFHLSIEFAQQLLQTGTLDSSRQLMRPGKDEALIDQFDRIIKALKTGPDSALGWTLLAAHQLILEMHSRDQDQQISGQTAIVRDVARRLSSNLDQNITIDEIAHDMEIPVRRLRAMFHRAVGMDADDFRLIRRIDRARTMIAEGAGDTQSVARQVGYQDHRRFNQQYRQIVGERPPVKVPSV